MQVATATSPRATAQLQNLVVASCSGRDNRAKGTIRFSWDSQLKTGELTPKRSVWDKISGKTYDEPTFPLTPLRSASFDDAVEAASRLSVSYNQLFGRPPGRKYPVAVAVLQASNGAYSLGVLKEDGYPGFGLAIDDHAVGSVNGSPYSAPAGAVTVTYRREDEALRALVGHDYWIDFRNTPVGEAGAFQRR